MSGGPRVDERGVARHPFKSEAERFRLGGEAVGKRGSLPAKLEFEGLDRKSAECMFNRKSSPDRNALIASSSLTSAKSLATDEGSEKSGPVGRGPDRGGFDAKDFP